MIVLSLDQYNFLMQFKIPFQSLLEERHVDFNPIEIKSDSGGNKQYVLPEGLLTNVDFYEIKQALIDGGHLEKMIIRDVLPDEFLILDL